MKRSIICVLTLAGCLPAATVTYKYDDTGRLISTTYGNGAPLVYAYDKAGNVLSQAVPAGAPAINPGGIVNTASYTTPLTRGEVAVIFGTNLSSGTLLASTVPLPTNMGGVQVTVGGVFAPLYFVSPLQIDFQVPYEVPLNGNTSVVVIQNGTPSAAVAVTTAEYAPAIFTYPRTSDVIDPVIVHVDNSLVTPSSPATAGETLVMYSTGAATFDIAPVTGAGGPSSPAANTVVPATVMVGTSSANVQFSGLAPTLVGVVQVNFVLPSPLPAGATLPLTLSFGAAASVPVTLYVH
jgi:uncharacterized protein (TIGR03437 family)